LGFEIIFYTAEQDTYKGKYPLLLR